MDLNASVKYYYDPEISDYFFKRYDFIPLLILTTFLRTFTYYIIATKSESIGIFKYYLLNQMVWSHLFELLMIVGNPVVLVPYTCGFMNGPILNFVTTEIALVFIFVGFCIFGLKNIATFVSLLNRFLFTFYPNLRKYLDNKFCFMGILILTFSLFAYLGNIMLTAGIAFNSVRANAVLETGDVLVKYFKNPSFIFARSLGQKIRVQFVVLMLIALVVSFAALCSAALFIRTVFIKRKTAKTVNRLMMSLLMMTLVQLLTNVIFLILPIIVVLAAVGFQVKHTVNIANAFISMVTYHGLIEIISVLYSVSPYRKYCGKKLFCISEPPTIFTKMTITSTGSPRVL